jgi:hypothetical protein
MDRLKLALMPLRSTLGYYASGVLLRSDLLKLPRLVLTG